MAESGFQSRRLRRCDIPGEPVQPNMLGHALPADVNAAREPHFREHPRGAACLAGVHVNATNRGRQIRVRDCLRGRRPADAVVVLDRELFRSRRATATGIPSAASS